VSAPPEQYTDNKTRGTCSRPNAERVIAFGALAKQNADEREGARKHEGSAEALGGARCELFRRAIRNSAR
jgi:hypothetical protein